MTTRHELLGGKVQDYRRPKPPRKSAIGLGSRSKSIEPSERQRRRGQSTPPNPKWKWECEQLHDYILFMSNTGLRPDEAGRLEFRDVVIVDDDDSEQRILEIDVRGKRGVGYCKSMPGAVRPFERIRDRLQAVPAEPSPLTRDRREKLRARRARGTAPERVRGNNGGFS